MLPLTGRRASSQYGEIVKMPNGLWYDQHYEGQVLLVDILAERIQLLGGIAFAMAADIATTERSVKALEIFSRKYPGPRFFANPTPFPRGKYSQP